MSVQLCKARAGTDHTVIEQGASSRSLTPCSRPRASRRPGCVARPWNQKRSTGRPRHCARSPVVRQLCSQRICFHVGHKIIVVDVAQVQAKVCGQGCLDRAAGEHALKGVTKTFTLQSTCCRTDMLEQIPQYRAAPLTARPAAGLLPQLSGQHDPGRRRQRLLPQVCPI